ncbi:MAG: hypothetical protein KDD69_16860, partial [Bdellovibrionales bacterium]|nr:hypothetical protein [Bdellovibrionales bacterium]
RQVRTPRRTGMGGTGGAWGFVIAIVALVAIVWWWAAAWNDETEYNRARPDFGTEAPTAPATNP